MGGQGLPRMPFHGILIEDSSNLRRLGTRSQELGLVARALTRCGPEAANLRELYYWCHAVGSRVGSRDRKKLGSHVWLMLV